MEILRFAILGLGTGGIYFLVASGLVLVYRASGVLNFATGATGATAGYVFYDLKDSYGVPPYLALLVALALGAGIGAATQLVVMARLRTASALTKLIATLGVLTLLTGIVTQIWGPDQRIVTGLLPVRSIELVSGLRITVDRLVLIGVAVVISLVLAFVYRRTMFGLATSAVAENRRGAASLGWSSGSIELVNWTVGGALSALAVILLAPTTGLQITTLALLVVPALAAALVGRFSSFSLTLVGAMVMGVIQAELARYVSTPGVGDSVPFLVIIVVIFAGGRSRPSRADLPTRLPIPGRGLVNVPGLLLSVAVLAAIVWTVPPDWTDTMTSLFVWGIVVLSVVVVAGYAGQASLGQWALAGLGAWVASMLVVHSHLPFALAALLGVVAAVPAGLLVAVPAMRTRGVELSIATLGMALVITSLILGNTSLTGGIDGIDVGSPRLFGISIDPILHSARYATVALVLFVLLALMVANVRRGRTGRRLLAVRSNERAAAALGIGVYGVKLYAFGLAAAIAAVGGVLAGFRTPTVIFSQFDVFGSVNALMFAVVGGLGWVSGALFGAGLASGTPGGKIVNLVGDVNAWLPIIGGLSVILILIANPSGLAELHARALRPAGDVLTRAARRLTGRRRAQPAPVEAHSGPLRPGGATVRLEVRDLSVRYGGLRAVDGVSLDVRSGEVVGLIGPNGAGKTSLLDAVTGFAPVAAGEIRYGVASMRGRSAVQRARAGIGRSFQSVDLFDDMTVRENLMAAVDNRGVATYAKDLVHPGQARFTPVIERAVAEFGLAGVLEVMPGELSHGTARLVGVARALAAEPAILFLDEPAAGLDTNESRELGGMIRRLADEWGIGIVLVEHDVALVLSTCDRVAVLDFGRLIATGTPEEVRRDPEVIRAYLGAPSGTGSQAGTPPAGLVAQMDSELDSVS